MEKELEEAASAKNATEGKTWKYQEELDRLQFELAHMQNWIRENDKRLVVIFEGRDASGKGGAIKRITQRLNPRFCRVAALVKPTERERNQWYFQRYVQHLPANGEIVLFDRSWYNRAGVEHVMGFCSEEEYQEFLLSCPDFERLLVRSGITLIKYWFSVSAEEQERRFQSRINDPTKRWKLSPVDLASRTHWDDFSRARDVMFERTDHADAHWYVIEGDDKKRARLNCIHHLLSMIPYEPVVTDEIELPDRGADCGEYQHPPRSSFRQVPEVY